MADEEKDKVIQDLQNDLKQERDKRKAAEAKNADLEKLVLEKDADIQRADKRADGLKAKLGEYESKDKKDAAYKAAKEAYLKQAEKDGKKVEIDDERAQDAFSRLSYNEEKLQEDAAWAIGLAVKEKGSKPGTVLGGQPPEEENKNKKAEEPNATKWLLDVIDGKDPR